MSRLGAQCFGSWISKRRSVLQIPVTDEKIRRGTNIQLYTTGYKLSNYILSNYTEWGTTTWASNNYIRWGPTVQT